MVDIDVSGPFFLFLLPGTPGTGIGWVFVTVIVPLPIYSCVFVYFFAEWSAEKRSALKVFLEQYEPPSNESDTVDNNGDNEALPKGSDTRDTRTENNDSSAPKKEARCSPLDQLVDAATAKTVQKVEKGADPKTVQKVEEDAVSESHIASNASSNNVSGEKHPNDNPNELGEKEESKENPEKLCKKEEFETVSKVEEGAVNATDIASDTNNHNITTT